jgi:AcrR family transcriptional regulator
MTAGARREQLLDVTTDIISEHGFTAVSIESVARGAGITRPIIYQHFGDLQGLLTAVVERVTERALAQVEETELRDLSQGPPRELMIESLTAYLYAVRDNPTTWRLVLMPPEGAPLLLRKRIEQGRATVRDKLTQSVRPALTDDGESPDAELSARLLSAVADEYARLVLTDPVEYSPERLLLHAQWAMDQVIS